VAQVTGLTQKVKIRLTHEFRGCVNIRGQEKKLIPNPFSWEEKGLKQATFKTFKSPSLFKRGI
jgi:hypothetical protein